MNWQHGYLVGKAGKPHTRNPFRQWHPITAARYYAWLEEWKRGRRDRIAANRRLP